jgi:hypothetical protein
MYPSTYRTHLHPKSLTIKHEVRILPNPVLKRRELNPAAVSPTQVSSSPLLPCLSILMRLRCSPTHTIELGALWLLGTRLSCRAAHGHHGQSKILDQLYN